MHLEQTAAFPLRWEKVANQSGAGVSDDGAQVPVMPTFQTKAPVLFSNWVILSLIKHFLLGNYMYFYKKPGERHFSRCFISTNIHP